MAAASLLAPLFPPSTGAAASSGGQHTAVLGGGAHPTNDAAATVGPHHADLEDCRRILTNAAVAAHTSKLREQLHALQEMLPDMFEKPSQKFGRAPGG